MDINTTIKDLKLGPGVYEIYLKGGKTPVAMVLVDCNGVTTVTLAEGGQAALTTTTDPVVVVGRNLTAEDDKRIMNVSPIGVTGDDSYAVLEGLFFNMPGGFPEEDEPAQALVIKKDVLMRSSMTFIGRFRFHLDARGKVVGDVWLDGKPIAEGENSQFGSNFPYQAGDGYMDIPLPEYPRTARSLNPGIHELSVRYGVITGITESALGLLTWGTVKAQRQGIFKVQLLPAEPTD